MLSDNGIVLKKNEFVKNGVCVYEDVYRNSVWAKREQKDDTENLTIKLRFADKNISAAPIYITVPVAQEEDGQMLHLDFKGGQRSGEDIDSAIEMVTIIVQRWINMMYDIRFLYTDTRMLQKLNNNASAEDVAFTKYSYLKEYEELSEIFSFVNS